MLVRRGSCRMPLDGGVGSGMSEDHEVTSPNRQPLNHETSSSSSCSSASKGALSRENMNVLSEKVVVIYFLS